MNTTLKDTKKWMMLATAGIVLLSASCKKEKPVLELPPIPTKWERITGTYKVYDTTGAYLYEMEISHKIGYNEWGKEQDSLIFQNFDGEFNFATIQSNFSDDSDLLIKTGNHSNLYDSQNYRWKILYRTDEIYNNVLSTDTIKMIFGKTNINYYLHDLTPYYACDCKQIAVKQQ